MALMALMANLRTIPTLGDRIRITGGYTSGFDYLRLVLALLVVLGHSVLLSGDKRIASLLPFGLDRVGGYGVLAMFFSLSGFLVAASLVRTRRLKSFLGLRALRIAPALIVEVVVSSMLIGAALTSVTWGEYFTSREFALYQLNMIGLPHYLLPGVFDGNPISRTVNGSIWTVPYEAECYIALAALSIFEIVKRPRIYLAIFVSLVVALWFIEFVRPSSSQVTTATGRQLVLFFLAGVILYLNRDIVPFSKKVAIVAALVAAVTIVSPSMIYLSTITVAYVTAYLGLLRPAKLPIIFNGDYSYGVYLYAYPIQQAAFQLFPVGATWWGNFIISMMAVSVLAAFSWHAVEKPTLRLKRLLVGDRPRTSSEMVSPDKTKERIATAGDGRRTGEALS